MLLILSIHSLLYTSFLYIVYASWPRLTIALAVLDLHTLQRYRSFGRCPAIQDVEREVEQAL